MLKNLAAAVLCAVAWGTCQAAHWYRFDDVISMNMLPFFDADTVKREGQQVTFWAQYVYNPEKVHDGTYVTITKQRYDCAKRTVQTMTSTYYAQDHTVRMTDSRPTTQRDIVPDSIAEGIMETVCKKGFPKAKGDYTQASNNDPVPQSLSAFQNLKLYEVMKAASAGGQ